MAERAPRNPVGVGRGRRSAARARVLLAGVAAVSLLAASDSLAPPRLVTNEFAYRHPDAVVAAQDSSWIVTSGSLFERDGVYWTGPPDAERPDAYSQTGTDSAVFRAVTRRQDYQDVRVSFQLRVNELVRTARTPGAPWDGVHILLRYQGEAELYAVSISRRDGTVAIKKKVAVGPSNGGTYYTLVAGWAPFPLDSWQAVTADSLTSPGGVRMTVSLGGAVLLEAFDDGSIGGDPLRAAGRVGLRGDNSEFEFRAFTVGVLPPSS